MTEHVPTFQLHRVDISAATPFTQKEGEEISRHRQDTEFMLDCHMSNREYKLLVDHKLVMDRDLFAKFVDRLAFVAFDQGIKLTDWSTQ